MMLILARPSSGDAEEEAEGRDPAQPQASPSRAETRSVTAARLRGVIVPILPETPLRRFSGMRALRRLLSGRRRELEDRRVVDFGRVDPGRHVERLERTCGKRTKHLREGRGALDAGVEPQLFGARLEDDGHAVVYARDIGARIRREKREGAQRRPFPRTPLVPQARDRERLSRLRPESERHGPLAVAL